MVANSEFSKSILQAALSYAEMGYSVLPLVMGGKKPLTMHGFHDATADPKQIESWWKEHPNANLGIRTDGLLVVDIDGADNQWLAEQPDLQLELAGAPISQTPGGGRHLLLRQPDGLNISCSQSVIAKQVDVRADSGYIVVPPSRRPEGAYRWVHGELDSKPKELPLAPDWLVAAATSKKKPLTSPTSLDGGRIPEGQRNSTLTSIAGCMRRQGMPETAINAGLQLTNLEMCDPPLDEDEVHGIAKSVSKYEPASGTTGSSETFTDLGNAERFARLYGDRVRYCYASGEWLAWNGARWRKDDEGLPIRLAGAMARGIQSEAERAETDDERTNCLKWAKRCESRGRMEATASLAKVQPGCVVRLEELDQDRWLFNTQTGTINLRTGELLPHSREHLITKLAPVEYNPMATCPRFDAFLERAFAGDQELIQYVLRLLGLSLTGDVREQVFPIFHGAGANGKSVLLDTITGLMGDYAGDAPPQLLTESKNREHPTEIADLCGRRLVVASETEEGAVLRLQMVKRLTGDKTLKGRFMRQDYFTFDCTHKTILVTNNRPVIREQSEAVWRRVHLVPFNVVIPPDERDPRLLEKIAEEWPGILARLVRACLEWQESGLNPPEAVRLATSDYRSEEDATGRFIKDRFETDNLGLDSPIFTPWKLVFAEYRGWGDHTGETLLSARRLASELDRRGFPTASARSNGQSVKGRRGLSVRPNEEGRA